MNGHCDPRVWSHARYVIEGLLPLRVDMDRLCQATRDILPWSSSSLDRATRMLMGRLT